MLTDRGRFSGAEKEIKWRGSEYEHRKRESHWYWITGTVTVILILLSIKQGNYFFAVFIALASLLLMLHYGRSPTEYDFIANSEGIRCGKNSFYAYKKLSGFAFRAREGETDVLILRQEKKYSMYVKIPVPKAIQPDLRKLLKSHVLEMEYEETLSETVADILGL